MEDGIADLLAREFADIIGVLGEHLGLEGMKALAEILDVPIGSIAGSSTLTATLLITAVYGLALLGAIAWRLVKVLQRYIPSRRRQVRVDPARAHTQLYDGSAAVTATRFSVRLVDAVRVRLIQRRERRRKALAIIEMKDARSRRKWRVRTLQCERYACKYDAQVLLLTILIAILGCALVPFSGLKDMVQALDCYFSLWGAALIVYFLGKWSERRLPHPYSALGPDRRAWRLRHHAGMVLASVMGLFVAGVGPAQNIASNGISYSQNVSLAGMIGMCYALGYFVLWADQSVTHSLSVLELKAECASDQALSERFHSANAGRKDLRPPRASLERDIAIGYAAALFKVLLFFGLSSLFQFTES